MVSKVPIVGVSGLGVHRFRLEGIIGSGFQGLGFGVEACSSSDGSFPELTWRNPLRV